MQIITTLTKRSVREPSKSKKFVKFYTSKIFQPGSVIEIIDGNKKSPIIILKSENATSLKDEIRSGDIAINPLRLSKTGDFANGVVLKQVSIPEIKKCLTYPQAAQKSTDLFLKKFFPKKRKKVLHSTTEAKRIKGPQQLKDMLSATPINRKKMYNSRMQELVDIIRTYFGDTAAFGAGSFSYYIGFFKKLDLSEVYQVFGEVKQMKHKTYFEQKKLFWFKIGKLVRERNKEKKS